VPKTIVICCDGTWNTPEQDEPTNVTKMTRAIQPRAAGGEAQLVYYDKGVGTGNALDRFLGGTMGVGLSDNVQEAYRFLALNYEAGDRIVMFGFSRGAFTVRSLAGLVGLVGLLRKGDLDQMAAVWDHYRTEPAKRKADALDPAWTHYRRPEVDLLGVWDTVGSLGIPGNVFGRLGRRRHEFHDVTLGIKVRRAFQALAIDEHRRSFLPAIWDTSHISSEQDVEQVWFAGAHSNIGGGYPDMTLSDIAFLWMVDKARPLLTFDEDYLARRTVQAKGDLVSGAITNSFVGRWRLLGRALRPIGTDRTEHIHPSVFRRREMRDVLPGRSVPFTPYPYLAENLEAWMRARVSKL
jgi:uncharacterized protein (DUF2235 family)